MSQNQAKTVNRLCTELPRIGIRPVIDGRRNGIRESLEDQTMNLARAAAELISSNLRHPCGEPVECVIADTTIGGVAEATRCARKFKNLNVAVTLTVTPCWCYGSETMDMDPLTIKAIWGFNGTERPGAVYLAAVLAAHSQKGLPAFGIYGHEVKDCDDTEIPDDVREKILRFARAGLAVASMRGTSYLSIGSVAMGIAGSIVNPDFFEEYLNMRCESVDETEILRRMDEGIYDPEEYQRARQWVRENLQKNQGADVYNGKQGKTPEEHIADIRSVVEMAAGMGIAVNVYLEDWSNGMKDSPDYVFRLMDGIAGIGIRRFMLPDTLGILNPLQVIEYFRKMKKRYPELHFDFHAHNDYDLAVSNVLAAVLSGAKGLHTTINGLGERAGNAPLASVQAILKDHFSALTNINEEKLNTASRVVESYSGIPIPANQPIVGENVFTQVAGVHADGDNKNNLYCNDLLPERFGRKREYALGKTSGKANIRKNLEDLGLELDEESMRKVTARIIELGDKKELVTQEDLPYIVSDVLKHGVKTDRVKLKSYIVNLAYGLKPMATIKISIDGREYEESSSGDGQYDAFVRALRKIYKVTLGRTFPMLTNYAVTIPPGGRTDAFVQTVITWSHDGKVFRTRGFDADQTEAAIKATFKMLNIIEE